MEERSTAFAGRAFERACAKPGACAGLHKSRCRSIVGRNHHEHPSAPLKAAINAGVVIIGNGNLCSALLPRASFLRIANYSRTCFFFDSRLSAMAPPTCPVTSMSANMLISFL